MTDEAQAPSRIETVLRGSNDKEAQEAVRNLKHLFDEVIALYDLRADLTSLSASPRERMAADVAATDDLHFSEVVSHYQDVALDNLRAVAELMRPPGSTNFVVPRYATFPLIRSAIESSAQTLWVLQPDDQTERVRRFLTLLISEAQYDRAYLAVASKDVSTDSPEKKRLNAQARQMGAKSYREKMTEMKAISSRYSFEWDTLGRFPGYAKLIAEVNGVDSEEARHAQAMWHLISGLTHPSVSRGVTLSNIREQGVTPKGEPMMVTIMADPRLIRSSYQLAHGMYGRGEKLIIDSMKPPSPAEHQANDA